MKVELTNPMLGDKLRTLSVEYDLPEELLVNVAVKRLVDDIEFVRDLRIGKTEGAYTATPSPCQSMQKSSEVH